MSRACHGPTVRDPRTPECTAGSGPFGGNDGGMPYVAINPATGQEVVRFDNHDAAEIERRLDRAHDTWQTWRMIPFAQRTMLMNSAAQVLEAELPTVATLLTTEMGKTFASAKGEVAKCAMAMRYYAEHAERYLE